MEAQTKQVEYETYHYPLDDDSWQNVLPSATLVAASEQQTENPKVSVIIANYNNGPYLQRMMDSLVHQTIGIENLQILFVDDQSPDNSLSIVMPYTQQYPSIEVYRLDTNTGGAHGPRNVGLLHARGEYLAILDADDWYAPAGLQVLANLLDESGDDIVFAGVATSRNGHLTMTTPAYSDRKALHRDINDLPYEWYDWMGPQGNMVRTSFIKAHGLHFIDQKVADDVSFFYQTMRLSGRVSQTTELTSYINRDDENAGLSRGVNESFLTSWLRALSWLKENYSMDTSMELFLSRRLEWLTTDFALRWDTGFGLSLATLERLHELFQTYLGNLPFDPSIHFDNEAHKIAWRLLQETRYEELLAFNEWHGLAPVDKKQILINGQYYFVPNDPDLPNITLDTVAKAVDMSITDNQITIDFVLYSDETLTQVELRRVKNPFQRRSLQVDAIGDNTYRLTVTLSDFNQLNGILHDLMIVTNHYHTSLIQVGKLNLTNEVISDIYGHLVLKKHGPKRSFNEESEEITDVDVSAVNITNNTIQIEVSDLDITHLYWRGIESHDLIHIEKVDWRFVNQQLTVDFSKQTFPAHKIYALVAQTKDADLVRFVDANVNSKHLWEVHGSTPDSKSGLTLVPHVNLQGHVLIRVMPQYVLDTEILRLPFKGRIETLTVTSKTVNVNYTLDFDPHRLAVDAVEPIIIKIDPNKQDILAFTSYKTNIINKRVTIEGHIADLGSLNDQPHAFGLKVTVSERDFYIIVNQVSQDVFNYHHPFSRHRAVINGTLVEFNWFDKEGIVMHHNGSRKSKLKTVVASPLGTYNRLTSTGAYADEAELIKTYAEFEKEWNYRASLRSF